METDEYEVRIWGWAKRRAATSTFLAISLLGSSACATRSVEREDWRAVETEHFEIVSNASEPVSVALAGNLELMRAVFERVTRANFEERVPTQIYVFEGARIGNRFGLSARGIGGFFVPTLSGNFIAVYTGAKPFQTIGHEYLHFLMHNHDRDFQYPAWYDEGFAEVLSHSEFRDSYVEVGVAPGMRLVPLHAAPRLLPLARLMTARSWRDLRADEQPLFYPQSWLLTHYLFFGKGAGFPDRSAQVVRYLNRLNRGSAMGASPQPEFGTSFEELDVELARYLAQGRFPSLRLPLTALRPGRIVRTRVPPADEVLTGLGELRLQAFEDEAAQSVSRRTGTFFHRATALNPQNARAQAGFALFEADPRRAESRLRRALSLAPEDPLVICRYADWLVGRVEGTGPADDGASRKAALERARSMYARAIELAPELPLAHAGLGATYRLDDGTLEPGIEALERARALLPGNLDIALTLGELHLRAGHPEAARQHLERVQRWSHGGPTLERAEKLLGELDASAR